MIEKSENNNISLKNRFFIHKQFIIILILGMILRFFTFFVIFVNDMRYWVKMSSFLVNGVNPYETNFEFYYKYPPLFYYILTLFGFLSNYSYVGPKLMIFIFDLLNIVMIYKLGVKLKNNIFGLNVSFLYAINPIILLQFYNDVNEFVVLFFTLLAIYYLLDKKLIISSISLAMGIGFKLYPVFFLIPILIYIYKNSNSKVLMKVILYISIVLLTLFVICLPFIIISPGPFLQNLFIHSSRMNLGDSLTEQIPQLLFFYKPAFFVFGIEFSYQFLIQICVLGVVFLLLFLFSKKYDIYDLFTSFVIIAFILPLINYQIQLKYFYLMSFPFLLCIVYKKLDFLNGKEVIGSFIINFVSILLFLVILILLLPPIENLLSFDNLVEKGRLYGFFWIPCFILFVLFDYKRKEKGDFKVHILSVLPFIIYNLFPNILVSIFTILLIGIGLFYFFNKCYLKVK